MPGSAFGADWKIGSLRLADPAGSRRDERVNGEPVARDIASRETQLCVENSIAVSHRLIPLYISLYPDFD